MTLGRTRVGDWSVVMSLSRPWTVTRGRAAAVAISIFWGLSLFSHCVTYRVFRLFYTFFWLRLVIY